MNIFLTFAPYISVDKVQCKAVQEPPGAGFGVALLLFSCGVEEEVLDVVLGVRFGGALLVADDGVRLRR